MQAYVKTTWVEDVTPTNAANLTNLETGVFLASAPLVTTLPSPPVDGQECNYLADATNGVIWHFVYRSASGKWHFTGGGALYSNVDSNSVPNGSAWGNYGGPSIVVPLPGDYEVTIGGRSINDLGAGGNNIIQSYTVGGSTPLSPDGNDLYTPTAQAAIQQSNTRIKTAVAGATIAERVSTNAGNAGISARFLRVTPRRVG